MADNTIANSGQVDLQTRISSAYQMAKVEAAPTQAAREVSAQQAAGRTAARETARETVRETPPGAETKPSSLPVTNNDVVLKFRVDEKTQAITVFVVDRASDSVVRTIPADELGKMSAGDLLKMAA